MGAQSVLGPSWCRAGRDMDFERQCFDLALCQAPACRGCFWRPDSHCRILGCWCWENKLGQERLPSPIAFLSLASVSPRRTYSPLCGGEDLMVLKSRSFGFWFSVFKSLLCLFFLSLLRYNWHITLCHFPALWSWVTFLTYKLPFHNLWYRNIKITLDYYEEYIK